jgi:hypothetical protein
MVRFDGGKEKTTIYQFGLVEDDFLINDFKCVGEETSLWHCPVDSKNIQCDYFEGVRVIQVDQVFVLSEVGMPACPDPGARTPIGMSGNTSIIINLKKDRPR